MFFKNFFDRTLTLIWMGFLGVRLEEGETGGEGVN